MSVFRTYPVEFNGTVYNVTGSLALIKRLEQQGIYLSKMTKTLSEGGELSAVVDLATMVSLVLETGGAKVSPEEVFQMLVHNHSDAKVKKLLQSCMTAILPDMTGKNQTAPAKKKAGVNR